MIQVSEYNEPAPEESQSRIGNAERDIVTLGIATAAIILFVGTGSSVVAPVVRSLMGTGLGPDKMLLNAMLLNIALIIFGWRRYRQLRHEVDERKKAEAHARVLAETDPLTGCLNRRSLGAGAEALVAASRPAGNAVIVMMIDLDNFKQVNDFNGHFVGDQILIESAKRITALLPPAALLARLGGDEFACVVTCDARRMEIADNLAAEIIEAVSVPVLCNGAPVHVTASIGLARSGEPGRTDMHALDLLQMADIAMYHAKKQGRNRSHWFEAPMEDELRFRKELEDGIRRGIAGREFVPFYEQQIDLETGKLTGFEMLARWHSPTLGLVSPEVFIPISEDIGAIGELSECVIRQALEDAKGWDPSLTLAVNISPLQLRDPWFAQKLLKLLVSANFPPQRLEIEITESCLHENIAMVRSLIASLKNQGIRVSLDDFGTGYNSLAQLRNLPFDRIKIDRTFVSNLPQGEGNAAIFHAIALLGKGLGLPITVEGVESPEVLEMLRQYGNIKGQGYLYGQPQSAQETRERLARLDLLRAEVTAEAADEVRDAPAGHFPPAQGGLRLSTG